MAFVLRGSIGCPAALKGQRVTACGKVLILCRARREHTAGAKQDAEKLLYMTTSEAL
jgi:hypothetical protein